MDWGGGNRTDCINNETVNSKNCKYSVSYNNTCANLKSYVKCLLNVANTREKSNNITPNVNNGDIWYYNLSPMLVQETGARGDHCNVPHDPGYGGHLTPPEITYTYHFCQVNGLQSKACDGLQPQYCQFKSFESMRQGYNIRNNWQVQKGHQNGNYNANQLIWCTVGFTNKYWNNTGRDIDTQLVFISDPTEMKGFYFWNMDMSHHNVSITKCNTDQVEFLYVYNYCKIPIVFHKPCVTDPKLTYVNYLQDVNMKCKHNMSYVEYMQGLIDNLIHQQDRKCTNEQSNYTTVINSVSPDVVPPVSVVQSPLASHLNELSTVIKHDINDRNKKFGFLAHDNTDFTFIGPDRPSLPLNSIQDYLKVSRTIRETGLPNYNMARFPIESDLNIEAWEKYLRHYDNKRLLQYLKYGFPLSIINPDKLNNTNVTNHFSALQFPGAVEQYLQKEIQCGAMLGPFDHIDCPHYHCSPLLTRPKESNRRRVILNLSYPAGASLNDAVTRDLFDNLNFTLKFPTVDNVLHSVRSIKGQAMLAKIDISRAFRNLRVDPADAAKFGIKWKDKYYLDRAVAFGWIHGSGAFQMTSDAIVHIMSKENCHVFAYIDDFILVAEANDAYRQFNKLSGIFEELGLPMNAEKRSPPTRLLTCLGITFDLDKNSLYIEKDKLAEIYEECRSVRAKATLSRRQFQSLLGKLIYLHKCIIPARIFINRILTLFRDNSHTKRIKLTKEFFQDIDWFIAFLPSFSGETKIFKNDIRSLSTLHIDACLTGVGGIWDNKVYAAPIPKFENFCPTITPLEMINVLIALRLWAKLWAHSMVTVHCDNLAVVQVINSGKTRDKFLGVCIRNLWLITASHDIQLNLVHIEGKKNSLADALSRIYSAKGIPCALLAHLRNNFEWERIPQQYFNLNLWI